MVHADGQPVRLWRHTDPWITQALLETDFTRYKKILAGIGTACTGNEYGMCKGCTCPCHEGSALPEGLI